MNFREQITDAIRYWELRRLLYNSSLIITFVFAMLLSPKPFIVNAYFLWASAVGLSVLAVVANLCYCVVYPIDLFVQSSDFRDGWRQWRWVLFVVGVVFACSLAGFMGTLCTLASFAS